MFKIGDKVYPIDDGAFGDCNAKKDEMLHLVGIITNVDKRYDERHYHITWIDDRDGEEAEFDHGLKNAWWYDSELTAQNNVYVEQLEDFFDNSTLDALTLISIASNAIDYLNDYLLNVLEDYGIKSNNPNYDNLIDQILGAVAKGI
jgi:hypothetical protein